MDWQPIETAPKSDATRVVYILITDGVCVPDVVSWRNERPAYTDRRSGTFYHARPEGWFCVNGGRSRFCYGKAKHWAAITYPKH